jgi:hypothetical protein
MFINSNGNYSESELVGMYVNNFNKNYRDPQFPEMPSRTDTLYLFDDGTYQSGFYGKGTYTYLSSSLCISESKSGFCFRLSNKDLFGSNPKLIMSYDWDYYYIKVK